MDEIKTYKQMREEFYAKYRNNIVPAVAGFEKERKTKLVLAISLSCGLFIAGLVFMLVNSFYASPEHNINIDGKALGILFAVAIGVYFIFKKTFEKKIKEKIMPIVCSCFEDLKWLTLKEKTNINGKILLESHLIDKYNIENFDDIFEGKYHGVGYRIVESEFIMDYEKNKPINHDNSSTKNRRTIFKGVVVILDMNKNFTGNTVIRPNSFTHSSPAKNLKHTTLEDVVFEKKFDVFTDDEVEARYLITTSFMERLNNMQVAFSADNISCAFYDKYLIIGLHTNKDLFSICSLFKPVDDSKQYFTMFEEIISIVNLIDHFKLNQKTGL